VLGQTIIQFPAPDAKTPADGLARAEAFIRTYAGDELITPAIAPHSTYTLDRDTLIACRDLALKYKVPLLVHLAETDDERQVTLARFGQRPVGVLDALGLWGPRIVAAHGVWVDAAEVALLARHGVGIAHNPESNMKLSSGVAPVVSYLAAGVAVGLGTDGAASNNDLDMFEAMRQAAFLHKLATGDPRAVSAQTALEMATLGGARVLGADDRLGSLAVGKRADLIVVRMDHPRLTPMYDPVSHLVYAARGDDVETTIVNGVVLMRDRRVLSMREGEVLAAARKAAEQVRAAVARP
jgi:5-methylthioadenosine/S-adenosylhomocysteine deaminase